MGKPKIVVVAVCLLIVGTTIFIGVKQGNKQSSAASLPAKTQASQTTPKTLFNKKQYSLTDPTSIWVVVNKARQLQPVSYAPSDLVVPDIKLRANITSQEKYVRSAVAIALLDMFTAAQTDDITLDLQSGYRSFDLQTTVYNGYVKQQGQSLADSQSARPGHSEHQTGLAADIGGISQPGCNVAPCFTATEEGEWLASHAHIYGFIIRYPKDLTNITGYTYEPWHVRYIGVEAATEMHEKNVTTLETFFDLPGAPGYN